MAIPLLCLFIAPFLPNQGSPMTAVEQMMRNRANALGGSEMVVEPPDNFRQFQTNLRVKYQPNGLLDVANLITAYLGNNPWPMLVANQNAEYIFQGHDLRILLTASKKRLLTPDENKILDLVRLNLNSTEQAVEQQESQIAKMTMGTINPKQKKDVILLKDQFTFRNDEAKKATLEMEKLILADMKRVVGRGTRVVKTYQDPWTAKFTPQTVDEFRQAYEEAGYWLELAAPLEFIPASMKAELLENRTQKKKAWDRAKEDPKFKKP